MANVRGRGKVGDVVMIDLGNESFGYGRVLLEPTMAFYDLRSREMVAAREVVKAPVLFTIWVLNKAIKSEKWEVIGNLPLEDHLKAEPKFFKQDMLSKKFFIYDDVKNIPATREDCIGLERASVWEANHVEDRLRDHFDDVPNKWVESMKLPEA
ncbi:immunity 26/phosphotriesterase HocA family protein [Paraburkholderia antibiotica]|uniref:Immunity protein 26 of polymorphic toxin system n=1 Tax=Paraburkholderia antibiotica TaxID=2728839 RepID=A0A7Y0A2S7_9BURK|nr:immunity 26/phosphotriesterase HocA family protein [Paraburkholderia antibiotica]NML35505.1 hypothetical protein [Paraburkholderia antibiotica]